MLLYSLYGLDFKKLLLVLSLFIVFLNTVLSQELPLDFNSDNYVEKVEIITDRDMYVVNDCISFKVHNLSPKHMRMVEWSKVIYIELISFDGASISQNKFEYNKFGSQGQIEIPKSILTGVYYLKVYTKWMRNYGVQAYYYKPITILNPYSNELLVNSGQISTEFDIDTLVMKYDSTDILLIDRDKYTLRDTINIQISNKLDNEVAYSLNVIKSNLHNDTVLTISPTNTQVNFDYKFLPETRGVSLSGIINNDSLQLVVPNTKVNLAFTDDSLSTNLTVFTNSAGKFNFALPFTCKTVELLLTHEHNDKNVKILVDNDFCNIPLLLPFISTKISEQSKQKINSLIVDSQIEQQYRVKRTVKQSCTLVPSIEYYSKPTTRVKVQDYIEMVSLSGCFKELVPAVGFKSETTTPQMHITGPYYYQLDNYKPLVLIDGVVITSIKELLKVQPQKLSIIETYNYPVVVGDIGYGGVVKMFSTNNDMAGYKLPLNGLILNYKMLTINKAVDDTQSIRTPLIKNTLYWTSGNFPADSTLLLKISTGDNSGTYSIIFNSIDPDGKIEYFKNNVFITD